MLHRRSFAELHALRGRSWISVCSDGRFVGRIVDAMNKSVLLAILFLLASPSAFANGRGTRIVGEGRAGFSGARSLRRAVLRGYLLRDRSVPHTARSQEFRDVQYDVWYYNFGTHNLMRRFVFRDGVLARGDARLRIQRDRRRLQSEPRLPRRQCRRAGRASPTTGSRRTNYDTLVSQQFPATRVPRPAPRAMDL